MYLVRISFTNRFGSPFSWDFQIDNDDHEEAISEAVLLFWSGLTREERWDAVHDLHVIAHPKWLPPVCKNDHRELVGEVGKRKLRRGVCEGSDGPYFNERDNAILKAMGIVAVCEASDEDTH